MKIACGSEYTCVLFQDGNITCWGNNEYSQASPNAELVTAPSEKAYNFSDTDSTYQICCTILTTIVLLQPSGKVKCFGSSGSGLCGFTNTSTIVHATDALVVPLGTDYHAVQISCGREFACALLDDATVKCWFEHYFFG